MTDIDQAALRAAVPSLSVPLTYQSLEGRVTIFRDELGTPHVRAGSIHDAFFGQGFVTAQDRLWQMEWDRRRAEGRCAEIVGVSAVNADVLARQTSLAASARADYDAFGTDTRLVFDAYADGVNAFISSVGALPIEYQITGTQPEPWRPWDSCAVYKVRHLAMGSYLFKLWRGSVLRALGPAAAQRMVLDAEGAGTLVYPPGAEYRSAIGDVGDLAPGIEALAQLGGMGGSNAWALHGSRTASGKPLVAGDPHRQLEVPDVYYQNHIACPDFDVIGLSFPGVPGFPHFGHNARVAWCITHGAIDDQDLFVERFAPGDPSRYEFQGEWRKADRRKEIIKVRGTDPVQLDVTVTYHGPVIIGEPRDGVAISFRWTATDVIDSGLTTILPMLRASTVEDLHESMRAWVEPCNCLISADIEGSIGFLLRGRVPVRNKANAWLPVPGWTGEHEWQGTIPFEELPSSINPPNGYVVAANNRIAGTYYRYHLGLDFFPSNRAQRIINRIEALENASVKDMASIHADKTSIPSEVFVEKASSLRPTDPLALEALETLRGWDREMAVDSAGAAIYSALRNEVISAVSERSGLRAALRNDRLRGGWGLGMFLQWVVPALVRDNDTSLLGGTDWSDAFKEAFSRAVEWLRGHLGPEVNKWRWGKLHHPWMKHSLSASFADVAKLLDPPEVEIGGDSDTVQSGVTAPALGHVAVAASVARYVFDLADWDNCAWIVPLGTSGHPGSPHYADQLDRWARVELAPMLYDWVRIAETAESRQELKPSGDGD